MRKKKKKLNRDATIQGYLMISVSTIGLFIFVVLPLLWILRWCMFSYRGFGEPAFVGLKHFVRAFTRTPKYWRAVANTFVFAISKLAIEIPLALVLGYLLTKKLRGTTFFRSVYFMPSMISVAIIGVVFSYFFSHNTGILNNMLTAIGLKPVKWFSNPVTATITIMIASIWQGFGVNMIYFITGFNSIDASLYESAELDGASNVQQFFKITLPMLGPVLQMVLMHAILGSLKTMDLVLTLTNGRPDGRTEMMMTYVYKVFFNPSGTAIDYGFGSALTVITAIMLGLVTAIYLKVTKKGSEIY